MFSAVFWCSQLFSDVLSCFPMFSVVFRYPQLFADVLGCFQMFSAVFQCSELFSDVFSWVITFMENHVFVWCITIEGLRSCQTRVFHKFGWVFYKFTENEEFYIVWFFSNNWDPWITTPCAHILWSSLYDVWQYQESGCFWWKSNWTKFDHEGILEAIGKPWVEAFLSHLEASWRFKVSVRLLYCFLAVVQLMNKISFLQVWYFYHRQVI